MSGAFEIREWTGVNDSVNEIVTTIFTKYHKEDYSMTFCLTNLIVYSYSLFLALS